MVVVWGPYRTQEKVLVLSLLVLALLMWILCLHMVLGVSGSRILVSHRVGVRTRIP